MDYEKPELIEQEMQRTRESLSEKVSALECRVLGTIERTSTEVTSTVDRVQGIFDQVEGFFADTASGIREGLGEAIRSADPSGFIERNPWASVGGAAIAGMITGWLVTGRRPAAATGTGAHAAFTPAPPNPPPPARPVQLPGWLDQILERVGDEARKLGEAALGVAATSARRFIETQVPRHLANLVEPAPPEEPPSRFPGGYRTPAAV